MGYFCFIETLNRETYMKTLLLLLALISASHSMAGEHTQDSAVLEAYNESDRMTQEVYNQCITENESLPEEERLNCENEYLGDIYN